MARPAIWLRDLLTAALLLFNAHVITAETCPKSGIESPSVITLAASATADSSNLVAVVVGPNCNETEIEATLSTESPGEHIITGDSMNIVNVVSYPAVQSMHLWFNSIKTFKADGTTLQILDLSSNSLTTLDGFEFPSSLQELTLDLNSITSFHTSDFPDTLVRLYFKKNDISSLKSYRFPANLQLLSLNGNKVLTTLEGAVFPDTLQTLECSDCSITEIEGVIIPSSLTKLTLGGATVTTLVVRQSDVSVLESATINADITVSACSDSQGTLTAIGSNYACVLDDVTFASLYPSSADSGSESDSSNTGSESTTSSTSSSSTPSTSSNTNGGSGTSDNESSSPGGNTSTSSSDSGSNTTMYVVWGVLIVAAIVIGVLISWLVQRRKNKRAEEEESNRRRLLQLAGEGGDVTKDSRNDNQSTVVTGADNSTSSGAQPRSNNNTTSDGFFSNDVRNDEQLIPFRLPHQEIKVLQEIASGGFGTVYLAQFYSQLVVMKQMSTKNTRSNELLRRFMDEIRLYARLDHPKIVRFIGLSWTNLMDLSLILEYMPNGDLYSLLKENRKDPLGRENLKWFTEKGKHSLSKSLIALDLVEALVYLHSFDPPIIHRDLKSKNILIGPEWEAKLSDFGISRESTQDTMTGGMGTTAWIAPEVLLGEKYSEKADIYSFGIVLSELDTCGHPYNSNRTSEDALTDAKIALLVSTNAIKPTVESDCPSPIRDVILSCVAFEPANRPTAVELHYQLRRIRNYSLEYGFF